MANSRTSDGIELKKSPEPLYKIEENSIGTHNLTTPNNSPIVSMGNNLILCLEGKDYNGKSSLVVFDYKEGKKIASLTVDNPYWIHGFVWLGGSKIVCALSEHFERSQLVTWDYIDNKKEYLPFDFSACSDISVYPNQRKIAFLAVNGSGSHYLIYSFNEAHELERIPTVYPTESSMTCDVYCEKSGYLIAVERCYKTQVSKITGFEVTKMNSPQFVFKESKLLHDFNFLSSGYLIADDKGRDIFLYSKNGSEVGHFILKEMNQILGLLELPYGLLAVYGRPGGLYIIDLNEKTYSSYHENEELNSCVLDPDTLEIIYKTHDKVGHLNLGFKCAKICEKELDTLLGPKPVVQTVLDYLRFYSKGKPLKHSAEENSSDQKDENDDVSLSRTPKL